MKTHFTILQKTAIVSIIMLGQLFATITAKAQLLYGLTYAGGANNSGAVIKYDNTGATLTAPAIFTTGTTGTGYNPYGSFIQASNGKLYGMTNAGGANGAGTVMEYDITGNTLIKKADFTTGTTGTGYTPLGSFIQAGNGKLYGMTNQGGANGAGTVVEYDITGNTLIKKADFTSGTTGTGYGPYGSFIQASNGKLYGMMYLGGANGVGTVVEYDITGNTLIKKADFTTGTTGTGYTPYGSFIQASNGKLYGMTNAGGANGAGTVVEYDITGNTLIKKADFTSGTTGTNPFGSFIQAGNGKLYGMTNAGGANGAGTVVEYDITGNTLIKKADFTSGTTGTGRNPYGSFIQASNGKLYGMTFQGGANNFGTVVEYDITGNTLIKKADFTGANGASPFLGNLIEVGATTASQTTDYYRTRQSGNWNAPATWESATDAGFTTGVVSPATLSPDFNANTITIQSPHTVIVTANLTTDQTTVNSGGSLIVNPNVVLTLNDGTGTDLTVSSGGSMTIKSIATGTGSIGNSAGTVSGDVTVERYISSLTNRAYRLLGPSVNSTTSIHANWQEGAISRTNNPVSTYGTHITGTTVDQTNGFDATQTGQGSLFTYQQTPGAWIPATNTNTTLDAKMGYLLYIRGDRSINLDASSPFPSTNTTLRATGSLLTGAQTYLNLAGNDFSLVTNPYASAINWSSIYGNNTVTPGVYKFSNYYTYWDPNIGSRGGYVTVTNTGTVSPDPAITTPPNPNGTINIQSGQAFFVNSIIASPTLTIQESDKSTTNNIDVFRVTSAAQKFTASLYYTDAILGRRLADGVTALYDNSYNASVDGNDAEEINNWDENIAIARGGKHLSIEQRPVITASDTLPLFMNNMKQQAYEFEFNPGNLNPNTAARLVDKFTGSSTILNVTTTTVVPFTVTSNAASSATDRFYILFSPSGALPITLSSIKAFKQSAGVKVEWTVQQEINMDRYEVEHSPNAQVFTKIASVNAANNNITSNYGIVDVNPNAGDNFYRIKMIDKSAKISYSEIVKVNLANGGVNMITVSPNPVNGNSITLQLINLAKGSYTITVSNKLGQQILSKTINHPGGSAIQNLMLSKMFTTGAYQLKLSGAAITVTRQVIKN